MSFRHELRSLRRSEKGTVAVISAMATVAVIGFAALAIDVGSLHYDSRRLQGATDLAALAAASNTAKATEVAQGAFKDNGSWQLTAMTVEMGNYNADAAKAIGQRFVANKQPINAARVKARSPSPVYFANIFPGQGDVEIAAQAIATRPAEAAFSIGSRLLSLEGGVINAILSEMLGGQVSLQVMDYRSLAEADIDLLKFLDEMAIEADVEAGTYEQVLDADVTAGKILTAMASTARSQGNVDAANTLQNLARAIASTTPVDLSRMVDIGNAANAQIGAAAQYGLAAAVNALQMVNALALVSNGTHQVDVNLGATVPGLLKTEISVVVGEPPQGTSWITVGEQGAFVRTAQTRLKILAEIAGTGRLAATTVKLPIFVDIAYAEGRLEEVTCGLTAASHEVTVATRPGVLNAWIGEVTNFTAVNSTPQVNRATLVNALNIARITASAHVEVGNAGEQDLVFSSADIAAHRYKTAVTKTYTQSLVSSLANELSIGVDLLNLPDLLGLLTNELKSLVRALIAPVTPALDKIVYTALTTLGIRLGEADVTVHGVRCKNAVVVQ